MGLFGSFAKNFMPSPEPQAQPTGPQNPYSHPLTMGRALTFLMGGQNGLDHMDQKEALAQQWQQQQDERKRQIGAMDDLEGLFHTPDNSNLRSDTPVSMGDIGGVMTAPINAPAAPRMPSREELFPKLFAAAKAGVDITPYKTLIDEQNPKILNTAAGVVSVGPDGSAKLIYGAAPKPVIKTTKDGIFIVDPVTGEATMKYRNTPPVGRSGGKSAPPKAHYGSGENPVW